MAASKSLPVLRSRGYWYLHRQSKTRGPVPGFLPASAPSCEASFDKVRAVGSLSTRATPLVFMHSAACWQTL